MKKRTQEYINNLFEKRLINAINKQNRVPGNALIQKLAESKSIILPKPLSTKDIYKQYHESVKKSDYTLKVREITKKQDISTLPNYSLKLSNQWHIDHIVSIHDGYVYKLPAEWIGDISNLRIISRSENCKKRSKSLPQQLEAMLQRHFETFKTITVKFLD